MYINLFNFNLANHHKACPIKFKLNLTSLKRGKKKMFKAEKGEKKICRVNLLGLKSEGNGIRKKIEYLSRRGNGDKFTSKF